MSKSPSQEHDDALALELSRDFPRLRAHVARRGGAGGGVEADDVAQEVAARALNYRARFDASRALWPWLCRLAERVTSDQRSAARARREREVALDLGTEPYAESGSGSDFAAREEIDLLLARLPAREREVVARFHLREQPVSTIAAELGLPEGTVKSHLARARRRLALAGFGGVVLAALCAAFAARAARRGDPAPLRDPRVRIVLEVERLRPGPPELARVSLEPTRVVEWRLEGERR